MQTHHYADNPMNSLKFAPRIKKLKKALMSNMGEIGMELIGAQCAYRASGKGVEGFLVSGCLRKSMRVSHLGDVYTSLRPHCGVIVISLTISLSSISCLNYNTVHGSSGMSGRGFIPSEIIPVRHSQWRASSGNPQDVL